MLKKVYLVPFLTIIIIVLVACEPSSAGNIDSRPTKSPFPDENPTEIRSAAISPTRMRYPTFTPTSTSTPTLTPMATLPPDEAQALIISLYKDETDCHLPCWFGVTVGETTWPEAYNYFRRFSSQIISLGDDKSPDKLFVDSGKFGFYITIPEKVNPFGRFAIGFHVNDNIVTYISSDFGFTLAHILSTYGKPDEVWIRLNSFMAPPFEVFMEIYYSELNMGVFYRYDDAPYARPGNVSVCLDAYQETFYPTNFEIWSTDEPKTWKDFQPFDSWDSAPPSLEEAIGMDIDTFYQTYKDPNTEPCFELPDDIWPTP